MTPAKTKAPEAKKSTEKGDCEKKAEPKEAKSEKKDAKAVDTNREADAERGDYTCEIG